MGIALQHSQVSVPADRCYLRHRQPLLEEPADCLMAQIVEPQILDASPFLHPLPSQKAYPVVPGSHALLTSTGLAVELGSAELGSAELGSAGIALESTK